MAPSGKEPAIVKELFDYLNRSKDGSIDLIRNKVLYFHTQRFKSEFKDVDFADLRGRLRKKGFSEYDLRSRGIPRDEYYFYHKYFFKGSKNLTLVNPQNREEFPDGAVYTKPPSPKVPPPQEPPVVPPEASNVNLAINQEVANNQAMLTFPNQDDHSGQLGFPNQHQDDLSGFIPHINQNPLALGQAIAFNHAQLGFQHQDDPHRNQNPLALGQAIAFNEGQLGFPNQHQDDPSGFIPHINQNPLALGQAIAFNEGQLGFPNQHQDDHSGFIPHINQNPLALGQAIAFNQDVDDHSGFIPHINDEAGNHSNISSVILKLSNNLTSINGDITWQKESLEMQNERLNIVEAKVKEAADTLLYLSTMLPLEHGI